MSDHEAAVEPGAEVVPGWWRDAVIYQVYIRSLADSDGDGVGDLPGIAARLPQLAELGVDAVWLTPFYPSPMADGGYDVADYCNVEPQFGSLDDFDRLLQEAHRLELKVIVDIVPNHTSDQHPWFKAALAAPIGSPARARYLFRDGVGHSGDQPPSDWHANFGGSAWQRVPDGQWYLHTFTPEQPDLDWTNPVVRADFEAILRFWLDRGVDGFRIDVAHGLAKNLTEPLQALGAGSVDREVRRRLVDHPLWDREEVHEIYRSWRKILNEYSPPRIAVAEAWVAPGRLSRYVRPDELHQAFNFDFLMAPWDAGALGDVIDSSLRQSAEVAATTTWVLSNHDVIRHVSRYALPQDADTPAWLMSDGATPPADLERGLRRARAATLLMLALPGSAYLYQGEELGLPEVADLPRELLQDPIWLRSGHTAKGRDGCRVPLPWEPEGQSLGFGTAPGWLPQPADWADISRSRQHRDPASTLEFYREALRLRRKVGGDGSLTWLERSATALSFERETGLVCVVNFGTEPMPLPAGALVMSSRPLAGPDAGGELADTLPGETAAWLFVGDAPA
jgi:alpha-glucosidase